MIKHAPPLKPLRAFEAAARHLSFTRAADELNLTQAAVSHQLKQLETALGAPLFRRLHRGLRLTDAGRLFAEAVSSALNTIDATAARLRRADALGPLNISVMPSFASTWLVPRLSRFNRVHPGIDVLVAADGEFADFEHDDIDLAIRWGAGNYPGLASYRFMTEELFPICSPALVKEGPHPLRRPEDLRYHTLLHDDIRTDWRMWLTAAGVEGVDVERGPRFNYSNMVQQAAIEGQGVALGRSSLAHDALEQGLLVRPFDFTLPGEYAYYIVCPTYATGWPKVIAFREWLFSEVQKDAESM